MTDNSSDRKRPNRALMVRMNTPYQICTQEPKPSATQIFSKITVERGILALLFFFSRQSLNPDIFTTCPILLLSRQTPIKAVLLFSHQLLNHKKYSTVNLQVHPKTVRV